LLKIGFREDIVDFINMSAKQRLYTLATTAVQELNRSTSFPLQVQQVSEKLFRLMLSEEPDSLWLECAGMELARDFVQQYMAEFLERDVYGGGIGLRLDDKTGGNAVADETGQSGVDSHLQVARPSAPRSKTPAAVPAGGGQSIRDVHRALASPTSPGNADYTTVKQHPRILPGRKKVQELETWSSADINCPQPPYNPPAVSKRILAKVAKDSALAILQNIQCNGRTVLQAPGAEALKWAESILLTEDEKIRHSKKRMNEALIVEHFAQGVPPTMTLEEFYGQYPDEYERRRKTVGGTKSAVTARIEALAHA
jgi:hypothetical protein